MYLFHLFIYTYILVLQYFLYFYISHYINCLHFYKTSHFCNYACQQFNSPAIFIRLLNKTILTQVVYKIVAQTKVKLVNTSVATYRDLCNMVRILNIRVSITDNRSWTLKLDSNHSTKCGNYCNIETHHLGIEDRFEF